MGITLTNNRITVQYVAGDTKGNSWTNPYTVADIYNTAVTNGWTGITKNGSYYSSKYDFYILGSSTYFWAYEQNGLVVYFDFPTYRQALQTAGNCYFRSGYNGAAVPYQSPTVWATSYANRPSTKMILTNSYIDIYNTVFNNMRPDINGLATKNAVVDNCTVYYAPTFDVGAYVEMTNSTLIGTLFTVNTVLVKMENITLIASSFYGNRLVNSYGKNIKMLSGSYMYLLLANGLGRTATMVDSNVPTITFNSYISYATSEYTAYLKTTFSLLIENGNGATATIYDKDNNIILSTGLTSSAFSTELTYYKGVGNHTYNVSSPLYTQTFTTYHPFKVMIEKFGYQTLEIPNISVVSGQPTYIRGALVPLTPPVYYQQLITGYVTPAVVTGGVSDIRITGEVRCVNN